MGIAEQKGTLDYGACTAVHFYDSVLFSGMTTRTSVTQIQYLHILYIYCTPVYKGFGYARVPFLIQTERSVP